MDLPWRPRGASRGSWRCPGVKRKALLRPDKKKSDGSLDKKSVSSGFELCVLTNPPSHEATSPRRSGNEALCVGPRGPGGGERVCGAGGAAIDGPGEPAAEGEAGKAARLPQLQTVALPAKGATTERPPLGPDDEWIGKLGLMLHKFYGERTGIRAGRRSRFLIAQPTPEHIPRIRDLHDPQRWPRLSIRPVPICTHPPGSQFAADRKPVRAGPGRLNVRDKTLTR